MTKDYTKVPSKALGFGEDEQTKFKFACADDSTDGKKKRTMSMTGYSGGVIKNHWYWGNLAIDISGMSFPKKAFPILRDHSTSMIIGHSPKPKTDGNKLQFDDVTLCDTKYTEEFVSLSDQGTPFEASIYAQPTSIERVEEGETVDVNGYKFKGPGIIWRKSTFKECSVCVFGYDSETNAVAMNENGETLDLSKFVAHTGEKPTSSEEPIMTLKELQEKDPDGYKKLTEEVTAAVAQQFSDVIKQKDEAIVALTQESQSFSESKKTVETQFSELSRKFELMHEKTLAAEASAIVVAKLSACDLNDRLKDKVTKFVDYSKFVKNDTLDVDAFSTAVDAEIKDYQEMFKQPAQSIQGGAGAATRELGNGGDKFTEDDAKACAKSMALSAGIEFKE